MDKPDHSNLLKLDLARKLAIGLLCLILASSASGADLQAPMTFALYAPCDGNGLMCGEYILAQGTIQSTTPAAFASFARKIPYKPAVYFDSPGGDLAGGLRLGEVIRRLGLDTHIGGPYEKVERLGQPYATVVQTPICFSACAYAFLGGVVREVQDGGKLGVHQFRGSRSDAGESSAQVTTAVLGAYIKHMGIDHRLLDLASVTEPGKIHVLSLREAQLLNVDNTDPPKAPWRLEADANGHLALVTEQRQARRDSVAVLLFYRNASELRAAILFRPSRMFRAEPQLNEIFSGKTSFVVRAGHREVTLEVVEAWSHTRGGYMTVFHVPIATAQAISSTNQFDLKANWANALIDVNPSTTFGTNGFPAGLAALLRQ